MPKPKVSFSEESHAFFNSPGLQKIRNPVGKFAEKGEFILDITVGGNTAEELVGTHYGFSGGGQAGIVPGHLARDLGSTFLAELLEEVGLGNQAGDECCGAFL